LFLEGEKASFTVISEFVGLMAKCEWVGSRMWPAFAVDKEVLRGRNILAPGFQDLYCSGVVPVISEGGF
jgi:hypothetical protein